MEIQLNIQRQRKDTFFLLSVLLLLLLLYYMYNRQEWRVATLLARSGHHLLFFAQCAMAKYSETNYKQFQYKLEPARHKKPAWRSAQNSIKSLSNFPITTKCCSCSHYPNHVWINSQLGFVLSYSIFNWHYLPFYSAVCPYDVPHPTFGKDHRGHSVPN